VTDVEFSVEDPGAPRLDGQEGGDQVAGDQVPGADVDQLVAPTAQLAPAGWTAEEAAKIVGGAVAGLTTFAYWARWHQPPGLELLPEITGDPEHEFPLLGAGLAPVLDMLAPRGSPQAIGLSLGAGVSELFGGVVRRLPVLERQPPQQQRAATAAAPAPAPVDDAPPGSFRFRREDLAVLGPEGAYDGLGIGIGG
jgi:hypothetical protein